jgi:hypothetical protein
MNCDVADKAYATRFKFTSYLQGELDGEPEEVTVRDILKSSSTVNDFCNFMKSRITTFCFTIANLTTSTTKVQGSDDKFTLNMKGSLSLTISKNKYVKLESEYQKQSQYMGERMRADIMDIKLDYKKFTQQEE